MTDEVNYIYSFLTDSELADANNFVNDLLERGKTGGTVDQYTVKLDRAAGKLYCHMKPEMFPKSVVDKAVAHAKSLNENAYLESVIVCKYAKEYGQPQLAPHFDRPSKVCFMLDLQIDSNVDWPITIEGVDYSVNNNDAVVLETVRKVHWRKPQVFNDGEFVTVLFFSCTDDTLTEPSQEGQPEKVAKFYKEYAKQAEGVYPHTNLLPKLLEMYAASEKGFY